MKKQMSITVKDRQLISIDEYSSLMKRDCQMYQINKQYRIKASSNDIERLRKQFPLASMLTNVQLIIHSLQCLLSGGKKRGYYHEPTIVLEKQNSTKSINKTQSTKESEMKNTKRSTSKKAVSSKADAARAIFKKMFGKKNIGRKDIIAAFMKEAKLSKAGASTYYQNIASAQ